MKIRHELSSYHAFGFGFAIARTQTKKRYNKTRYEVILVALFFEYRLIIDKK